MQVVINIITFLSLLFVIIISGGGGRPGGKPTFNWKQRLVMLTNLTLITILILIIILGNYWD